MKVKAYFGNYILPFGQPLVIVTGSETVDHFICERFVFFETSPGVIKNAKRTDIRKKTFKLLRTFADDNEALDAFIEQEGRMMAEQDLYLIIVQLNAKRTNPEGPFNVRIKLTDCELIAALFYLKRKMRPEYDWLWQHTRVDDLQAKLRIMSDVQISEGNYE